MRGDTNASDSQSNEELVAEETKEIIQEPENNQEENCKAKTNSVDGLKSEEPPHGKSERQDHEKKKAMKVEQDKVFGLQAGFLGIVALFATIIADIFYEWKYTDIVCGLVVAVLVFFSLSKTFYKFIRCFMEAEGASDVINTMTVLATIYFCAEKMIDVASCERRIIAIIFIVFCVWLLFYVFYYKRYEYREGNKTRITIETDKNVDIHITKKNDPDSYDE